MSEYLIYGMENCSYCVSAKKLLSEKGLPFVWKDVTKDAGARRDLMESLPGTRMVPQIFHGESHIGGYDHLLKYLSEQENS